MAQITISALINVAPDIAGLLAKSTAVRLSVRLIFPDMANIFSQRGALGKIIGGIGRKA